MGLLGHCLNLLGCGSNCVCTIYIYIYINSLVFAPNNSLTTKFKNLDGHMVKNWTLIEIKFRILFDLDSLISILNNSLGTKLQIIWDTWHKTKNPIKI